MFRIVTSLGQKITDDAKTLAQQFLTYVKEQLENSHIPEAKYIANVDETPLWFDLPNSKSYDFRGVKTVKAKTSGYEKLGYTVVFEQWETERN